ncbi:MAG: TMEM175 family protein [Galbitalea sp.]
MESERAVDRLIFFTDAVVAIAITLLILPLVEIVNQFANEHRTVESFLYDNLSQMFAFALSFVIIARVWIANHEILANTVRATAALIWIDFAWVFTVVVIPLPTEITAAFPRSELTVLIYAGCASANALLLTAMSFYLFRHPGLQTKPISRTLIWGGASNAAGFLLAIALVLIVPSVGYYSLLILVLTLPFDRIVKPRIARREIARREAARAAE